MPGPLLIGGAPVVTLRAEPVPDRASFVEATVLPGRGFMLLQATIALPDGRRLHTLNAPEPEAAAEILDGGPEDFAGNKSFSFGGAILAPYANRIRGRPLEESREIETVVGGRKVRLPRNWGGKARGAETYAMHGLILATSIPCEQPDTAAVRGRLATDFEGRWPGRLELAVEWRLADGELSLRVDAANRGREATTVGLGWHPYFVLPSGDRRQARLHLPAAARTEVNNYDEVLPTGRVLPVRRTAYDFRAQEGRALEDLYLDDCFTELSSGTLRLTDPAAGYGLTITSAAPPVKAVQVYAPTDQPFVVIEPQFNLPDPFGPLWPADVDTGMTRLAAASSTTYAVRLRADAVT